MHPQSCNMSAWSLAAMIVAAGLVFTAATPVGAQNRFELNDTQFNHWVFRGDRQSSDAESEISMALDAADRICRLTKAQQEKLRLAGRGDFARFDQRVDEMRAKLVGKSYDQNKIGEIYQELQPLAATYQAGLLGPSSLFAKVLRSALTPEQLEEYDAAQTERLRSRHAAKVRLFAAVFERRCPLTDKQRSAVVDLLLTETRPPLRPSEFDWYVVSVQAARIPDGKFKAILDDAQYRLLEKSLRQARGLEQHLKQQGVLPDP